MELWNKAFILKEAPLLQLDKAWHRDDMNCSEEEIFYAKQPQAHLIIKTKVLVTKARRRTDAYVN